MLKKLLLIACLLTSTTLNAGYVLKSLVYHGYCPPAAVNAGLCTKGTDFIADAFIINQAKVGDFVVNQMVYTVPSETSSSAYLKLGSRIRITYVLDGVTRTARYDLYDNILGVIPCDLCGDPIDVVNSLARSFTIHPSSQGCDIIVRGEWTEPSKNGYNIRDATMTFYDNSCGDSQ